jgi:hypothetical protein
VPVSSGEVAIDEILTQSVTLYRTKSMQYQPKMFKVTVHSLPDDKVGEASAELFVATVLRAKKDQPPPEIHTCVKQTVSSAKH